MLAGTAGSSMMPTADAAGETDGDPSTSNVTPSAVASVWDDTVVEGCAPAGSKCRYSGTVGAAVMCGLGAGETDRDAAGVLEPALPVCVGSGCEKKLVLVVAAGDAVATGPVCGAVAGRVATLDHIVPE